VRRQFSRIVLTAGPDLVFYPLLLQYSEFVDGLRRKVTCRVFDPYPALIAGSPRGGDVPVRVELEN